MRERHQRRPTAITTWWLAVVWPIAAARRAERIGWVTAWGMFVPAAGLGLFSAAVVAASIESGPARAFASISDGLVDFGESLLGGYEWQFAWATAVCLPMAGLASLVVAAYALTPLASRDEPVGDAYWRTFRRLLVTSSWGIGASIAVAFVAAWAYAAGVMWTDEWNRSAWVGMAAWAPAVTLGWSVPVAIAMVGRGERARCPWPARCEGCGYSLMSLTREQPCPECGRPVIRSIGAGVRPGVTASAGGMGAAWSAVRPVLLAIGMPWRFGRDLRVSSGGGALWVGPATTAGLTAVLTPTCGLVTVALVWVVSAGQAGPLGLEAVAWFVLMCGVVAAALTATVVGVLLLAAATLGSVLSWVAKRNLLPASAQAACYASPGLLMGPFLMWMSWSAAILGFAAMDTAGDFHAGWMLLSTLLAVWNIGAPAAVAIYFFVAVGMATWAARFANR